MEARRYTPVHIDWSNQIEIYVWLVRTNAELHADANRVQAVGQGPVRAPGHPTSDATGCRFVSGLGATRWRSDPLWSALASAMGL